MTVPIHEYPKTIRGENFVSKEKPNLRNDNETSTSINKLCFGKAVK